MSESMNVRVLNQSCSAGDTYAKSHLTEEPKAALVSCEGACLKGEIARRAANLIAHELAPDRTARICHGGAFLLNQGGMRKLVAVAGQTIVIEGCPMSCGARVAKAAFPDKNFQVVVANALYESDDSLFGVNETTDEYVREKALEVAEQVLSKYLTKDASFEESVVRESCCACS
jgi:uncharacterized metal-binding protein